MALPLFWIAAAGTAALAGMLLSKNKEDNKKSENVTRARTVGKHNMQDYVEDVLRLYYVTLNQADLCEWYLGEKTACLKELDENGYEYSLAQNKREKGNYLAQKIIYACVGWSKEPKKDLQLLQDKLVNSQMVIDFLGQWIYFKGATFQKEEKYSQYLKELYNLIDSYAPYEPNLTAKIEERRQSFSLPSSNK